MKKWHIVTITETLVKDVKVLAEDRTEAHDLVHRAYTDEKIILDSTEYAETDFQIREAKDEELKHFPTLNDDGSLSDN